jgi:hypothetical protein
MRFATRNSCRPAPATVARIRSGGAVMAHVTASNPISDLTYDWLAVLQNKAEGVNAYEKYIKDAEEAGSTECVEMFRSIHEQDVRMLEEIKDHFFGMIRSKKGV